MSVPQLPAGDLEHVIPQVLAGAAVVALVPATELRGWAADTAWAVARAAASGGRRTALVDCFVAAPTLHGVAGAGNEEGIVDAFEYGASLNRIVQAQPQANLFFIPTGTFATDAAPMMQNPRWRRLSAGFRHEEALLLLYVAAEHLGNLAADPDGIVVLAPQGLDLAVADAPALAEAVGRGMPLLAVVANEAGKESVGAGAWDAANEAGAAADPGEPAAQDAPAAGRASVPRASHPALFTGLAANHPKANWLLRSGVVLGLAAVGAMVWYAVTQSRVAAAAAGRASAAAADTASPVAAPVSHPVDSLPFVVQIAALPRLADALARADSLEGGGTPSLVAPVRLQGRGVVYRVLAGPFASAARADSALAALRASGAARPAAGLRDSVPLSIGLTAGLSREAAQAERLRLRAAGVPTFILGAADGTFQLFAGAYSASAQAGLLQDLLTPTGSAGALVPRAGYVP